MSLAKIIENRIIESLFQDDEEKEELIQLLLKTLNLADFEKVMKIIEASPEYLDDIFDESCAGGQAFRAHRSPRDLFNSLRETTAIHAEFV